MRKKVKVSENFNFSKLIKVLSLEKLRWNGKTCKFEAKSSFLTKTQCMLSLLGFSHTLQMLNGANEAHRVEMRGLYTCRYVEVNSRVTKKSN